MNLIKKMKKKELGRFLRMAKVKTVFIHPLQHKMSKHPIIFNQIFLTQKLLT